MVESLHRVEHYLVVQRASVERVGVADDGGVGGIRGAGVEEGFELPGGAGQEERADGGGGFGHGVEYKGGERHQAGAARPAGGDARRSTDEDQVCSLAWICLR